MGTQKKIGEILIKGGVINQKQLEFALDKQKKDGGFIGEILIELGYITDRTLIDSLREQAE